MARALLEILRRGASLDSSGVSPRDRTRDTVNGALRDRSPGLAAPVVAVVRGIYLNNACDRRRTESNTFLQIESASLAVGAMISRHERSHGCAGEGRSKQRARGTPWHGRRRMRAGCAPDGKWATQRSRRKTDQEACRPGNQCAHEQQQSRCRGDWPLGFDESCARLQAAQRCRERWGHASVGGTTLSRRAQPRCES